MSDEAYAGTSELGTPELLETDSASCCCQQLLILHSALLSLLKLYVQQLQVVAVMNLQMVVLLPTALGVESTKLR